MSQPLYDAVGLCCTYVDVIASVPSSFLPKYDIPLSTGRFFDVEGFRQVKAELDAPILCPGGTIPNTLAGIKALGGSVGYFGKVADDAEGRFFLDSLQQREIDNLSPGFVAQAPYSGTCIVLLTENGERSFALHRGCWDQFEDKDFDPFDFNQTKYLLVTAELFESETAAPVIEKAVRRAVESSCKIVLSLSEVRNWEGKEALVRDLLAPGSDIIIGNEVESDCFYRISGPLRDEKHLIVITHGEKGADAHRGLGPVVHVDPAGRTKFVSALGAGDQFLAGLVYGECLGLPLEKSMALASRTAAAIIQETEAIPALGQSWEHLLKQTITEESAA